MDIDPDLFLVVGIVLGFLSVPPLLSAFSGGRPPRTAAIMIVLSGGLIVWAAMNTPGGYSASEIPSIFLRVIAEAVN